MQLNAGTLQSIREDGAEFARVCTGFAEVIFASAALAPRFSAQRLHEAYGAWLNDLDRVEKREQKLVNGLYHFKLAGHLAFWLRRFSPIIGQECQLAGTEPTEAQSSWRDMLFSYSNEFTAFMLGYNICLLYERHRGDLYDNHRAHTVELDNHFLDMACHFLKYKSTSPHAMTMIYKALFVRCSN